MKRASLLAFLLFCAISARAAEWPQWRGPSFNGSTDEKNLPSAWSKTENVAWRADLPGESAATPVVWGNHVFVSAVDADRDMLLALAVDGENGKVLWQHDIVKGVRRDDRSNYAAASPVTDGKLVVFYYGNGELRAYDLLGKQLWARSLQKDYGPFAGLWTPATSPVLYEGKLYVQVLQRDTAVMGRGLPGGKNDSYLLAIDPTTGKTLWRHIRPSDAYEESREAFTTPMPWEFKGRKEILVVGGDAITGHDPATGRELWRWGDWNPQQIGHWRQVVSPVAGDGVALVCAPKGEPIYAIRAGGQGALGEKGVAWISKANRDVSADVPTPAFYDGDFFVLNEGRKKLSRIEPASGKAKWSVPMPGRRKYEASPLAADGKIYSVDFTGQVAIHDARDGKLLKTIEMDQPANGEVVRSSIIAAGGRIYIRTTRALYCIGKAK